MRVELITIGDELLLGFTVDTNAVFISRELAGLGVEVARRTTVGDEAPAIANAVREAMARSDGVITTGGLGPTSDDITKPAIAAALGRAVARDDGIVRSIEELWRSRGRTGPLPVSNLSQADVPEGAHVLPNSEGTAPGLWIDASDRRWIAVLPGVPREMREMFTRQVRPRLAAFVGDAKVVASRTVRTTGLPESRLPDLLGDLASGVGDARLAYLPSVDGVDLRLTVTGLSAAKAAILLAEAAGKLSARLVPYAYTEDARDLAEVLLDALRSRGLRIGVAESCTGGMLAQRLTAIPGSSDVFAGGFVAYDDQVKSEQVGVDGKLIARHGAVSEPVALALADGARRRLGVDLGIGVTGIAGPNGGTPEKPVGTVWIAMSTAESASAHQLRLFGDREEIRRRSTQAALDMVRRSLPG